MPRSQKTRVASAAQSLNDLYAELLKLIGAHAIASEGDPRLGAELLRLWDQRCASYLASIGLDAEAARIGGLGRSRMRIVDSTAPRNALKEYGEERSAILKAIMLDMSNRSAEWEVRLNTLASSTAAIGDAGQGRVKSRRVFVVHGHDKRALNELTRMLESLDLKPIILQERPDQGMTVIEKFEANADVEFAVVLLTPDDGCGDEKRARQNVVFELGYFLGKIGREKVRALYKQDVALPSNIRGWLYIEMDDGGGWRLKLASEIKSAGLDVNLNRLGSA